MKRLVSSVLATALVVNGATAPFTGITLTAYWQLAHPSDVSSNPYAEPYKDLIGSNDLSPQFDASTGSSSSHYNVGANNAGGQTGSFSFAHHAIWSRILSLAEHDDLAAGDTCVGNPCSYSNTSLNTGLKCYWAAGQLSGSSVHHPDTSGNGCADLVDSGSSTQVTGPNGGADKATAYTGGSYATSAVNAKSDAGSADFSYFIAVDMQALTSTQLNFNCQIDLAAVPKTSGPCAYYQGQVTAPVATSFNTDHGNGVDLIHSGVVVNKTTVPAINTWYSLGYSYSASTGVQAMYVDGSANVSLFNRHDYFPSPFVWPSIPACYGAANVASWDCASDGSNNPIIRALQKASPNSAVGFSNQSRTWGFWINAIGTSGVPNQTIASRLNYTGPLDVVNLGAQISAGVLFALSGESVTGHFQYCSTPITDGLHFVLYYYDASDGTQHAYLDNVAFSSCATVAFTPTSGTLPFLVGANTNTTKTQQIDQTLNAGSSVSRMFFADGVPTSMDRAILYNNGNGWQLFNPALAGSVSISGATSIQ